MRYRSSSKRVYSAKYHLIWCPKYRRRILVWPVETRLKEVVAELGGELVEVEVMPDHVRLLVEMSPAVSLSRVLRREFPGLVRMRCLWSPSWFVSTVGGAPLEVVRCYVENQERVA